MKSQDRDYFLQRALEEENAAVAATSLKARRLHEELAMLYRTRAHLGGTLYPDDSNEDRLIAAHPESNVS